jgi:hypothetical protein
MKKLLLLIVFMGMAALMNAQAIRWATKSISPGTLTEIGNAIAADSAGYTYITGNFKDTIKLNGITATGRGLKDAFVAKLDTLGHCMWIRSLGGTGDDEGLGISVDLSGNVYIAGYFTTKMFLSPVDSLVAVGGIDMFAAKYDANGNLLMKVMEGTAGSDYARGIAADPNNTGDFAIAGDINNNQKYSVSKYFSSGTMNWNKQSSAGTNIFGTGVDMDNVGKVYISGYLQGSITTPNFLSFGGYDAFLVIYTTTGSSLYYYSNFGSAGNDFAYGVRCTSDAKNCYLCGQFATTINFGSGITLSGGSNNGFVVGFTAAGCCTGPTWAKKSLASSPYIAVTADKYRNVFVTDGYFTTYKYMRSTYNALAWYSYPTGSISAGVTGSKGLATDRTGNVYSTGKIGNALTFGDSTFAGGNSAACIEKISSVELKAPLPGTPFCISVKEGDSLMVTIRPSMAYKPGNVFTLQADSSAAGTFTSSYVVGTLAATGNGIIHAYIPHGTTTNNISLRVLSSNPSSVMGDQTYLYTVDKPIPVISAASITRCPGASGTAITVSDWSSTGPFYTYSWSPSTGISSSAYDNASITATITADYIISLTETGSGYGCTGKDTIHVNVYPNVAVITSATPSYICRGTTDTLHAIGTNVSTYAWTPTSTLSGASTANPLSTPTSASVTYTCTVTSPQGCTATSTLSVTSPQTTANAGPVSYNTCLGGAVPLAGTSTGTGGRIYQWTPATGLSNPNIANPSATPAITTMYHLVATDTTNGCKGKDSINIIVGPVAVSANDLTLTCASSGTLTATTTGNYIMPLTYLWSPSSHLSSTTTASTTANPIVNSTYFVTVTTGNGCSGSDSSKVTILSPNYNLSFNAVQQLFTSPPFACQFNNTTPSMSSYTFTWLWGDGTSTVSGGSTVFHVYNYNGTYDVTLIAVSNTTGCSDTLYQPGYIFCTGGTGCSVTSTVSTPDGTSTCMGDTLMVSANTGAGYTYQWNLNGTTISGATSSTYNATVGGNYSVMINNGACSVVSAPVSLSFATPPSAPVITHTGSITTCGGGTVYLTASSGYSSYHWNTGATTQNITATSSGVYTVTVTSGTSSCSSSSSYSLNASTIAPQDICVVGVDSATGKNLVIWNPPVSNEIDSFIVYKEGIVAGQFNQIGSVWYHSFSTFLDMASNPAMQAERYKMAIRDTCGVITLMSAHHKTIHLTINAGAGSTWNLLWNHYEGFSYGTYNIYRGTTATGMTLLTSLASTNSSYTDLTPPAGLVYYQIEAVNPSGCSPTTRSINYSVTRSNIVDDGLTTGMNAFMANDLFTLYPNPATDELNILFTTVNGTSVKTVDLIDMMGRTVLAKRFTVAGSGDLERLNVGELRQGIYFVKVKDNNSESIQRIVITK